MIAAGTLILGAAVTLAAAGGVAGTQIWKLRKDRAAIRNRLLSVLEPVALAGTIGGGSNEDEPTLLDNFGEHIKGKLQVAGLNYSLNSIAGALLAAAAVFWLFWLVSDCTVLIPIGACLLLAVAPYMMLGAFAERQRSKFVSQLPDAIDLMISLLRSGLSVPQTIKSVSEEMAAPCGPQFAIILQRVNLGQSLPDSIGAVAKRFDLFELDLIRRAAAIQIEVGGSLAELLQKTNTTLKERLKLKRKVAVLTAQSRLSGILIGLLPLAVAGMFQVVNPGYLKPLTETGIGRALIVVAIGLQLFGLFVIRKMATVRV